MARKVFKVKVRFYIVKGPEFRMLAIQYRWKLMRFFAIHRVTCVSLDDGHVGGWLDG